MERDVLIVFLQTHEGLQAFNSTLTTDNMAIFMAQFAAFKARPDNSPENIWM